MYIKQADLFWGMNREFVKQVMDISEKESYKKGQYLFHEGDLATHFYILIKGNVKLNVSEAGQVVYSVDHAGEAFGWSSLIGRDVYSASAKCSKDTILQKFERRILQKVLEEDLANGLIFFKRMAGIIGNRLLWSYSMLTSSSQANISQTSGSGQIEESEAAA